MHALVVGGTGPTGVPIVNGLVDRGYGVTVFHTGQHESADLADVEHVHGDPTDPDEVAATLGRREHELVVALYGRARSVAQAAARRCRRFVSIGGLPVYAGYLRGSGGRLPIPVREDAPLVAPDVEGLVYPAGTVRRTEDLIFELGAAGAFEATIVRYPVVYGPRVHHNLEWLTVRRVLDGRRHIVLPDGGVAIHSRVAVDNAATCVLAAIDHGGVAAGRAYNVADNDQYTLGEWVQATARLAGGTLDIVSVPDGCPCPADAYNGIPGGSLSYHAIVDTSRAAELGHRDVVEPMAALADAVSWVLAHAAELDAADRFSGAFDYEAEDELVARKL